MQGFRSGIEPSIMASPLAAAGSERQLEELVLQPDRAEAQTRVELLEPVRGVGQQEDRVAALGLGGLHGGEAGRAGGAAVAAPLERAGLVDLRQAVGGVEPEGGGGILGGGREVARADLPADALVHPV